MGNPIIHTPSALPLGPAFAAHIPAINYAASPVIETKIEAAEVVEVPAVEAVEAPEPIEIPTLKTLLPTINAAPIAAPAIHHFASPLTYATGPVLPASPYTSGPILATTAVKTTVEAIEAPK